MHFMQPFAIERTALIGWSRQPFGRRFRLLLKKYDVSESTLRHMLNANWLKRHCGSFSESTLRRTMNVAFGYFTHTLQVAESNGFKFWSFSDINILG